MMKEHENSHGSPLAFEGTVTALRTVIAGETDLTSRKHLARCHMREYEHIFDLICDDPNIFAHVHDPIKREELTKLIHDRVESAAAMWGVGEAFFQLPLYFNFKVSVSQSVPVSSGKRLAAVPKGGRGVGARFRYVAAIEFAETNLPVVRPYNGPRYEIETEGYWSRLPIDEFGIDAHGNAVRGKTWVKATNTWRERSSKPRTIYVKSSVAAAKLEMEDYLKQVDAAQQTSRVDRADHGVIYVLRCMVMKDEVYKVGWTSGSAEQRAAELSSATGVPSSFVVVAYWVHKDPEALEKGIHAMLAPYRVSEKREFFQVNVETIRNVIEAEIRRASLFLA